MLRFCDSCLKSNYQDVHQSQNWARALSGGRLQGQFDLCLSLVLLLEPSLYPCRFGNIWPPSTTQARFISIFISIDKVSSKLLNQLLLFCIFYIVLVHLFYIEKLN